jgi:putative transposon-encoded protein
MSKVTKEELIEDSEGVKVMIEAEIKKFGTGGYILIPKKYIGKHAKVYILADIKRESTTSI